MRNFQLIFGLAFSLLAVSTSAHPDASVPNALMPRQDATTTAASGAPTAGSGEAVQGDVDETPVDTSTTEADPVTTTDKSGSTITVAPSTTTNASGSKSSSTKSKKISADAPAGGVAMKTPGVYDGYQIYKIGDPVTFVWNYTSLQVAPTAINVQAYCTDGAQYFPIMMNASADTTEAIWDTGAYQSTALSKLPVATYTLFIYDNAYAPTAVASPGHLGSYSGLTFGMYTPKPAIPLASFECATCDPSSASTVDIRALGFLVGMGLVTALSFTWFVAGVL